MSLKDLKTYFLNQHFAARDEILPEHKLFCQSLNGFGYFTPEISVFLFISGLTWAGLSWVKVMSPMSAHQSGFSNIQKVMTDVGSVCFNCSVAVNQI